MAIAKKAWRKRTGGECQTDEKSKARKVAWRKSPAGRAHEASEKRRTFNVFNARRWQKANPERRSAYAAARRAAKARTPKGRQATPAQVKALFASYAGRCVYCSKPATTLDHVVPLKKGGTNELDNLAPACVTCNSSKRHSTLLVWMAQKTRTPLGSCC